MRPEGQGPSQSKRVENYTRIEFYAIVFWLILFIILPVSMLNSIDKILPKRQSRLYKLRI